MQIYIYEEAVKNGERRNVNNDVSYAILWKYFSDELDNLLFTSIFVHVT